MVIDPSYTEKTLVVRESLRRLKKMNVLSANAIALMTNLGACYYPQYSSDGNLEQGIHFSDLYAIMKEEGFPGDYDYLIPKALSYEKGKRKL